MNKKINKLSVLFSSIILISFSLVSFAATQNTSPAKLQTFIKKLESETSTLQGGAVAILYRGRIIYKSTFGKQRGNTRAITSNTLFPLASVSKPVSAMAIALMAENGQINLNEKFKLPYLQNPVSLTDMLSHTTGYYFSGNLQIEHGMSRKQILEKLKYEKPKCRPGQCYSYSNTTFSLVEEALNLKKTSLQSAMQNLRKKLKTTGIQIVPISPNLDIAYPHIKKQQALRFPRYYPIAAPAAAGVFASLDGMIEIFKLSFGYRNDLISKKTLKKIQSPIISNRDNYKWHTPLPSGRNKIESYYGLGWRILKSKTHPGKDLVFHSGFISGANTFIGFIPSEEIGIIILVNQNSTIPMQNGMRFWGEFVN